jgi:uncharacterized protein (TIGR04255 family)
MTWTIPPTKYEVFQRNPLVAVIVEVRFAPVLKVYDKVADIQDRIRAQFPGFQDRVRQVIDIGPQGPSVVHERFLTFTRPDTGAFINLSPGAVALEVAHHRRREDLITDLQLMLSILTEVLGNLALVRVGLRYVNVIDREHISQGLGREVQWRDLISDGFLRVPSLTDLEGTFFVSETASPVASGGSLVVRHGLIREERVRFRLDFDRYSELPGDVSELNALVTGFSSDIFSVFLAAANPALLEWMRRL